MTNLDSVLKKQRYHFSDKDPYSQSYGLASSQVQLWELDHREGRMPKNWCFWTVVLEKTLESIPDSKEIKPVNLWKDWYWSWSSNTLATWCKELTQFEKILMLGKMEGSRRRGWQRMRWLDGINLNKLWEIVKDREVWCAAVMGLQSRIWLSDWTTKIRN